MNMITVDNATRLYKSHLLAVPSLKSMGCLLSFSLDLI